MLTIFHFYKSYSLYSQLHMYVKFAKLPTDLVIKKTFILPSGP